MGSNLPNHVPVKIDPSDLQIYLNYLHAEDYFHTIFQVVKPFQLFGRVKQTEYESETVEHHVRAFVDGTLTSELELPRLSQMWKHLTSRSRSAHEIVIEQLESLNIQYQVDQVLRERYNRTINSGFPRDYMEFFDWLIKGVCFYTPMGYLWKAYYWITSTFAMFRPGLQKTHTDSVQGD